MDIVEFFQQSAGKWSSMRNHHHLAFNQQEGGKSTIEIELLEPTNAAVIQLCERYQVDPALAACGARITWDGSTEWDEKKVMGTTVIVPVVDPSNPQVGQLLHQGYGEKAVAGRYCIDEKDELTLITESETMYSKERIWFESPNVRLRHRLLKRFDGFNVASFCSEVRMGVVKAETQTADAAANSGA